MRRSLPLLLLALVLAACGPKKAPVLPLDEFRAAPRASFNLQVRTYQLGYGGTPAAVDGDVVEVERQAILLLEAQGYRYQPEARPDYAVQAHLLCVNPRQAARLAESGLPTPAFDSPWLDYAPEVHVWTPQLAAEAKAAEACQGDILLLVKPLTALAAPDGDLRPFSGQALARHCPFEMSCAYGQCKPALHQGLLALLRDVFPKR